MSDDSLRDFLSTVEKSAKRILREHGKKKILEANREKADAARRRAWEDSLAPGPSGSMSLEGTVRPDTMALMLGTTAVSMAATSHGLPPLGRTSSLAGATMGDTAASAPPAFPTLSDKLRSKSAMHKTQKSLRSTTRALEDLTKSPLATVVSKAGKTRGSLTVEDLKARTVSVSGPPPPSSSTRSAGEHTHDWGGVTSSDHSVQRRVCKACWAQSSAHAHAGTESALSGAAMQLAKAFETQGPVSMSSQDIREKYRDEESRKKAWEACQEALEEARILEEQQGVVVPVVLVDRHPLLSMLLEYAERECAHVAKQSRARALLKAYSFDVRAVWLSGDLPLEAPLPWRGLYGAPASPFPYPPGPHPQRALQERRDVASIEAGSHQIQSVSLSRAMAGAFVTQVDAPGSARGPGMSMLIAAADVPPEILGDAPPVYHPSVLPRRSLLPCPDNMAWVPWFRSSGVVGATHAPAFIRVMIQVHFTDDNVAVPGQAVDFFDGGSRVPASRNDGHTPRGSRILPSGPVTASCLPAAVIVMIQDARFATPAVGRIKWSEFAPEFKRLLSRRDELREDALFAGVKALPAEVVAEALTWLDRLETRAHPILITAQSRTSKEPAVPFPDFATADDGLDAFSMPSRPPFRVLGVDPSTPLPPRPPPLATRAFLAVMQPVVINTPLPMPPRGTRARRSAVAIIGDMDTNVSVPVPHPDAAVIPSARGKIRDGRRVLDDGSFAGIGVGARLPPIVTFDGVTRVGLSAALKDTFVGQRRIPSGFSNNEYVIGSQGSAVSFIGSRPDQSVVFDTAGWFVNYPEAVSGSQQASRLVTFGGVVDKREKVLHTDPAWRAARKAAEDRRLELERQAAGEGGHYIPVLQAEAAATFEQEASEEDTSVLPPLPLHQDDPLPTRNLALSSCGHVDEWQHVPGLTAVGRDWISAAVFFRDSAVSSGDQITVRLVNSGFDTPVIVPPLYAEEYEEVDAGKAKKKKRGSKAGVPPVMRAKLERPVDSPEDFWLPTSIVATCAPSFEPGLSWPVQIFRAGPLLLDEANPYDFLAPDAPSLDELEKKEPRTVVMCTDQAVPEVDCDHNVKGHRRAMEPFDHISGFRIFEVVPGPVPNPSLGTSLFGLSQGAAIPNVARVWPHRFTWHSDYQVRSGYSHTSDYFLYILQQREPPSVNSPNTYTIYMNFERVRALRSSSLRDHMRRQDELEQQRLVIAKQKEEALRLVKERERLALKERERAKLATQWREKHTRRQNRLRGKAASLSLSVLEWKAKRFAPGARVVARAAGWERWVIFEAGSGDASDGEFDPAQEKYAEVWYFHPESTKSSYDPPPEWPEKEGAVADLALPSSEEAENILKKLPAAAESFAATGATSALALADATGEVGIVPPNAVDGASANTSVLAVLTELERVELTERTIASAFIAAFMRWVAEVATRGSAELPPRMSLDEKKADKLARAAARRAEAKGEAPPALPPSKPGVPVPALTFGGTMSSVGTMDSLAGTVSTKSAGGRHKTALQGVGNYIDPRKRLLRVKEPAQRLKLASMDASASARSEKGGVEDGGDESEYDDEDVLGLSAGIKPGGDGKFDLGLVFRLLDRDKDGVISLNDWGVATGSGPGLGSRMTSKQIAAYAKNADDLEVKEKVMAGIFPHFKESFLRTCPPEIREDYFDRFPELLNADMRVLMGVTEPPKDEDEAADEAAHAAAVDAEVSRQKAAAEKEKEKGDEEEGEAKEDELSVSSMSTDTHLSRYLSDDDESLAPDEMVEILDAVLTPNIRVAVYREMKKMTPLHLMDKPDKYPNKLTWQEFLTFVAGASEGQDWFGLNTRLGGCVPELAWDALSERRAVAASLYEWQGLIDPATGDLYYYSCITGASMWDKSREMLKNESVLRRLVVSRLDNEIRGEEALLRRVMRSLRRDKERKEAERRQQMRDRHLRIRKEDEERAALKALTLKNVTMMRTSQKRGEAGEAPGDELALASLGTRPRSRAAPGFGDLTVDGLVDALSANPAFLSALAEKLGVLPPVGGGKAAASSGDKRAPSPPKASANGSNIVTVSAEEEAEPAELPVSMFLLEESDPNMMKSRQRLKADERVAARRNASVEEQHTMPGPYWRQSKPLSANALRTRIRETQVLGSSLSVGLNITNAASLVGLVNPRDVDTYTPVVEPFQPQLHMVTDVLKEMGTAAAAGAFDVDTIDEAGGASFALEEERKAKEAERKAGDKVDKVLTAFRLVKNNKFAELEDLLLEGEINVNNDRDERGNTLLLCAAQNGLKRIAKLLLRKGADINAVNAGGNSVLHYTCAYKFPDLTAYFMSKGADDSIANASGMTCHEAEVSGALDKSDVDRL